MPDDHHNPSAVLVPVAPVFTNIERLARAGFLAGCSGLTREAYELDLRQYASWCHQHNLRLFQARRAESPDLDNIPGRRRRGSSVNETGLISRRTGNYQDNPVWGKLLDQLWVR